MPSFVVSLLVVAGILSSPQANAATKTKSDVNVQKKIVILGDSLTAGYGVDKDVAFPALIRKKFMEKGYKNLEIIDSGISGSTSASGPSRLKWLLKTKPDLLLLELGANDGLRGQDLTGTKRNLVATIRMAKDSGMQVALVAMQIPANYGKEYAKKFADLFVNISTEEKIDLVPFFFTELMSNSKQKLVLADGLHPNEEGHKLIADKLFDYLVTLI